MPKGNTFKEQPPGKQQVDLGLEEPGRKEPIPLMVPGSCSTGLELLIHPPLRVRCMFLALPKVSWALFILVHHFVLQLFPSTFFHLAASLPAFTKSHLCSASEKLLVARNYAHYR